MTGDFVKIGFANIEEGNAFNNFASLTLSQ